MLDTAEIDCPWCGATFTALIDPDDAGAEYIQDCEICCHPIRFHVDDDGAGGIEVTVSAEGAD